MENLIEFLAETTITLALFFTVYFGFIGEDFASLRCAASANTIFLILIAFKLRQLERKL